jgi:hypothetical protein
VVNDDRISEQEQRRRYFHPESGEIYYETEFAPKGDELSVGR